MIEPTLLSIAKADLKTAKRCVLSEDKYEKHIAAYHTQQAIEKTIKYLAMQEGLNLWGHDIAKLISQCKSIGLEIPTEIQKNARVYTLWETISRYYPTQRIRRDSIQKAIRIVEEWIAELEQKKNRR